MSVRLEKNGEYWRARWSVGGVRQSRPQRVYFAGKNQRRETRECGTRVRNLVEVLPLRLLLDGKRAPCVKAGKRCGICH